MRNSLLNASVIFDFSTVRFFIFCFQYRDIITCENTWYEKVNILSQKINGQCLFTLEDTKVFLTGFYNVVKAMMLYNESFDKLKCEATLIRPINKIWTFPDDYRITKVGN